MRKEYINHQFNTTLKNCSTIRLKLSEIASDIQFSRISLEEKEYILEYIDNQLRSIDDFQAMIYHSYK